MASSLKPRRGTADSTFWQGLWHHVKPLVHHAAVMVVLIVTFAFVAMLLDLVATHAPVGASLIREIESIEVLFLYPLLYMFGLYALIWTAIELGQDLKKRWKGR